MSTAMWAFLAGLGLTPLLFVGVLLAVFIYEWLSDRKRTGRKP